MKNKTLAVLVFLCFASPAFGIHIDCPDVDENGVIEISDIETYGEYLSSGEAGRDLDLNNDGEVTREDYYVIYAYYYSEYGNREVEEIPACQEEPLEVDVDLDGSGEVDYSDDYILRNNYLSELRPSNEQCDIDGDCVIGNSDLYILYSYL